MHNIMVSGDEIGVVCEGEYTLVMSLYKQSNTAYLNTGRVNSPSIPGAETGSEWFKLKNDEINALSTQEYRITFSGDGFGPLYFSGSCTYQTSSPASGACAKYSFQPGGPYDKFGVADGHRRGFTSCCTEGGVYWLVGDSGGPDYLTGFKGGDWSDFAYLWAK